MPVRPGYLTSGGRPETGVVYLVVNKHSSRRFRSSTPLLTGTGLAFIDVEVVFSLNPMGLSPIESAIDPLSASVGGPRPTAHWFYINHQSGQ